MIGYRQSWVFTYIPTYLTCLAFYCIPIYFTVSLYFTEDQAADTTANANVTSTANVCAMFAIDTATDVAKSSDDNA